MNTFIDALSRIARKVAHDYEGRGGKLLRDGCSLEADELVAPDGGLGALLWMTGEFVADFDVDFATISFERSERASTGYRLTSVATSKPGWNEVVTLAFADFLRTEVMGPTVESVDFGPLFENFGEWVKERGHERVITVEIAAADQRRPE
ncbi:hypothetical protein [Burkholderia ubonensis]|uniref:hypothetical protein n=1 Tax=Burkholderia ubonensis TaxID=101571 RepID=UPI000754FE7A|nr:hypothetical protein [Burkholderia ubonensis]KVV07450.1 hypothetical protein WK77_16830 [Burkholderia ubonensis]